MKRTVLLVALAGVAALAFAATKPLTNVDAASAQSAGGPSAPVQVVNFPTDEDGRLLVTFPQRVFEEYLTLDPASPDCIGAGSGIRYFFHAFPDGGPWARVMVSSNQSPPVPGLLFGADQLPGDPADGGDTNCIQWRILNSITLVSQGACLGQCGVLAPGGN